MTWVRMKRIATNAAAQAEALARLPGDLDAFVEATAAAVLADFATLATTDAEEDN